jgi:phage FluMu protein Com
MAMKNIKCPYCGKPLLKAEIGIVEIKCPRKGNRKGCGKTFRFEITDKSVKHTIIRE